VFRLVAAAGLDVQFGLAIIEPGVPLTRADVEARIRAEADRRTRAQARVTEIRGLCQKAKQDDLADGYIAGGMTVDQVRDHLTKITARLDAAEVDAHLPPDQGRPKATFNVAEIYAQRNRLALPAPK
jgi:hypothetical protein